MILQWCIFHCLRTALENQEGTKILHHATFFTGADSLICDWTVHIFSAKLRKIGLLLPLRLWMSQILKSQGKLWVLLFSCLFSFKKMCNQQNNFLSHPWSKLLYIQFYNFLILQFLQFLTSLFGDKIVRKKIFAVV